MMNFQHILNEHGKWLNNEGNKRTYLRDVYFQGTYPRDAYPQNAQLHAYLNNADLSDADLNDADLWGTIDNMKEINPCN